MTDTISQVCTMRVPQRHWKPTSVALRMLRQIHREAGGTSRMVKSGDQVTLTLTGPYKAVLDAQQNFTKIMRMLLVKESQREQLLTMFVDVMHEKREKREREVASVLMDALLKKP